MDRPRRRSIRYNAGMPNAISNLSKELVRRGVLRALGAYVAIVWLLAQGLVDLLPAIGLPDWAIRVFLVVTVSATPLVAIIAWKYDLTTKGFLRDRKDVINLQAGSRGSTGGPTTRVTPREGLGRSTVLASWRDDKGDRCEQEFDTKFIVGRDFKADIRLSDDRVSRRHLEVYPVGDDWCIRDQSSLNGSYVNGDPVDVMKIERSLEVSLDKGGPKVQLDVRVLNDTLMTAQSETHTRSRQ